MDDGPLIDGELMPDERLTEVKLAESLQISRTPLRQALQRLETEGWIRRTSTGGIRVGSVSELEIEALYDVRSTLESLMLGQAITRLRKPDISRLHSNLAAQKRALVDRDFLATADLSEAFHREIWKMSRNNVCIDILELINDRMKRYRRIAFGGPANFGQGVMEHDQILDHISSRDVKGAQELLVNHIEHSRSVVKSDFLNWERSSN